MSNTSAKKRYETLSIAREHYLDRAREAADLTIPSLFPPSGHNGTSRLRTPYQGLGSRGLKNLASKLLLALFPPNTSFFRLYMTLAELNEMDQSEEAKTKVEEALSVFEKEVMKHLEISGSRVVLFEVLKQLLVAGNNLIYIPDENGIKSYRLDKYVVKRDPMGAVYDIIVKETVVKSMLPPEVIAACGVEAAQQDVKGEDTIDMYTRITRDKKHWKVHQEINEKVVPSSEGTYPLDKTPWVALRMTAVAGEDYGRGFIEEHIGDLNSHEVLSEAIIHGSAIAAKVVFLVNPNGTTRVKAVAESESGDVIQGREEDVTVLHLEKQADFAIAERILQTITERLELAFLLHTAVQRNAERVTAEEIRYVAGELEEALGGVYSVLSQELQLPLVRRLIARMTNNGELPQLPDGVVNPAITTGMEALGRGHDLNKLKVFLEYLQPLGPEVIKQYVNVTDYISRVATAVGIDKKGLVRSEDQVLQQQQAEQMQALLEQIGPQLANNLTPNIELGGQGG